MRNLAIIPARKGSKGVPDKNIKLLCGKPLIAYTIEAALEAGIFSEIHVSTDSSDIAEIAKKWNVEVPVLRPAHLAEDSTPMLEVILHVLLLYEQKGEFFDTVTLLQPTAPCRTAEDITQAHSQFSTESFDSLISVRKVPDHYNPFWVYLQTGEGLKLFSGDVQPVSRRQDLPLAFIREGSIYIFKPETVSSFRNIYGERVAHYEITRPTANIDTKEDFINAERILAQN